MRGFFHLGLGATLLLSFAQGPLQHAHASDPHHEHATGFAHVHWNWKAEANGLAWEPDDHDSDARLIDWLAGDGRAPVKFVVALRPSFSELVRVVPVVRIAQPPPHNHDPPSFSIPHLRGPPA